MIQLADRPRAGTGHAIADLRRLGLDRIVMLTGDNAAVAQSIASEIGISEVQADLMPQDKIDRVRALAGEGRTAMVGDGVNDAPALAAADVGIALGGQSSDTAMETADVVVMAPDLSKVAELIRLSPPLPPTAEAKHRVRPGHEAGRVAFGRRRFRHDVDGRGRRRRRQHDCHRQRHAHDPAAIE